MEVTSPQHLGDSFSCGTAAQASSFERLVDADLGGGGGRDHSFGSSRSFIDIDPAELFSMRWTTTPLPVTDFDFVLPDASDSPSSPMLVNASQIIRDGGLLPCEPLRRPGVEEHEGRVTIAPRSSAASSSSVYHSAQSTTTSSLSSCSSTRSIVAGNKNALAGRPGRRTSSSWKILLRYLRFLLPLYRKFRALRQFSAPRPRVAPAASPARASTSSSLEWCHGNADSAVRDAILYCKKSSGQV